MLVYAISQSCDFRRASIINVRFMLLLGMKDTNHFFCLQLMAVGTMGAGGGARVPLTFRLRGMSPCENSNLSANLDVNVELHTF